MNGRNLVNVIVVLAVVGIVAGAAWYRSQRAATGPQASGAPESQPALEPVADPREASEAAPPSAPRPAKLPRLVDLGAHECKACKKLAPILDALREEYKGRLDVEFIDVWKNPDAKAPYNIRLIPTQILFDSKGEEVWRHEGFISKEDLMKLFKDKVGVG